MEEIDEFTTIRLKKTTKDKLKPYKNVYNTYENAILELINSFEKNGKE